MQLNIVLALEIGEVKFTINIYSCPERWFLFLCDKSHEGTLSATRFRI